MLEAKIQAGNSCANVELDEVFSEIEEELENKLWELHDKMKNQKNS